MDKKRRAPKAQREGAPQDELAIAYRDILSEFRRFGYELSPAEATHVRKLIREIRADQDRAAALKTSGAFYGTPNLGREVEARLLWERYKINLTEWEEMNLDPLEKDRSLSSKERRDEFNKRVRELYQYVAIQRSHTEKL